MKIKKNIFISKIKRFFFLLVSFFAPFFAFAQVPPPTYTLLAPLSPFITVANPTLSQYIKGIMELVIALAGVVAVVMLVVCGIRVMASGTADGKSEAKECIWNAVFGLLLLIGSWVILNTLNPLLLKNNIILSDIAPKSETVIMTTWAKSEIWPPIIPGVWFRYKDAAGNFKNSPRSASEAQCAGALKDFLASNPTVTLAAPCLKIDAVPVSSDENFARLTFCGNTNCVFHKPLGTNKSGCSYKEQRTCTALAGLPMEVIGDTGEVKFLQKASKLDILITGGTEAGHSTHAEGKPIYDLRKTAELTAFIKANATVKNNTSFCSYYFTDVGGVKTRARACYTKWLYHGYWYTDETLGDPHFHVCKDGTTTTDPKKIGVFKLACTKI